MAHVGQEAGAGLGHVESGLAGFFEFLVGQRQARVGGLQLGGTGGDDAFQLLQVLGQAVLRLPALFDLYRDAPELAVDDFHQHADLVAFVALGAGQAHACRRAWIVSAEGLDQADQGLGQQGVEEHQQDQRQQQAAHEAGEQGDAGATEEVVAEHEGVDFQLQYAEGLARRMVDMQRVLVDPLVAEEEVAERPQAAFGGFARGAGQRQAGGVDDFRADYGGRTQQAEDQLLGQLRIDVVGDSRGGVVADVQQRAHFAIDGCVLAGIIDANLNQAEQGSQDKGHQHGEAGLFERQAMGQRYIHGGGDQPWRGSAA